MVTSVFIGSGSSSSEIENTRREMEMTLMIPSSGEKPSRIHGKLSAGGRRKSKRKESTQKNKKPRRGMGVEKLERLSFQEEIKKKMTEINTLLPPRPACSFMNGGSGCGDRVGLVGCNIQQPALYMFQGLRNGGVQARNHWPVVSSDQRFLVDAFGVGSGFRVGNGTETETETSKELSSIPNKSSEQCGICYKEVEVMAVHRKGLNTTAGGGGSMLMEYQFFPRKVGGSFGNNKNNASSKEVGEGTAAADTNSIDLSLKLSY